MSKRFFKNRFLPNRIVLMLTSFPVLSETFIIKKFVSLLNRGWDVHVVCSNSDPIQWANYPNHDSALLRRRVHLTMSVHPRWKAALSYPLVLLRTLLSNPIGTLNYFWIGIRKHGLRIFQRFYVDSTIVSLNPDLVHFEFGATARDRADLNELLDCKIIVSFRGYDMYFSGIDQPGYYDSIWQHADGLHFLGLDLYQHALQRGCLSQSLVQLIPPGVDADFFQPDIREELSAAGANDRPFRILSVGRLEWIKGYEFALKAVRALVEKGYCIDYRIVGSGQDLDALTCARHKLGLDTVVSFLGGQPQDQVKKQYQWADCLLHAAVSEGFCNAVLEAQAMQLPVVCSDVGGLPENVMDKVTGFVVPTRDPQAMADKLELLLENPELRTKMGQAGRQRVLNEFQLGKQIDSFSSLYQQMLSADENH